MSVLIDFSTLYAEKLIFSSSQSYGGPLGHNLAVSSRRNMGLWIKFWLYTLSGACDSWILKSGWITLLYCIKGEGGRRTSPPAQTASPQMDTSIIILQVTSPLKDYGNLRQFQRKTPCWGALSVGHGNGLCVLVAFIKCETYE